MSLRKYFGKSGDVIRVALQPGKQGKFNVCVSISEPRADAELQRDVLQYHQGEDAPKANHLILLRTALLFTERSAYFLWRTINVA